jgi:tetratricopeptide (TPR) repeat protein
MRITSELLVWLLLMRVAMTAAPQNASLPVATKARNGVSSAQSGALAAPDPAQIFQKGQDALNNGRLDEAERDFRQVLALNPQMAGAYANLDVVYMRRKQWTKALEMLRHAERLLPQVAGIRLDIGLAYYRQSEFLKAIPLFKSVVHDQPDAVQPRHLLGICYFFTQRWTDAAKTLEALWTGGVHPARPVCIDDRG